MTTEPRPAKPWWQAVIHGTIIHAIHADVPAGPINPTARARYGPAACGAIGGNARIFLLALHEKTREAVPWGASPWGLMAYWPSARCRACQRAVEAEQHANRAPGRLQKAIAALDAIDPSDPEAAHGDADQVLLDYAPTELRDAYQRLVQRAPWWASA